MLNTRYFFINDIQTTSIVEFETRKELLSYLDCYLYNHEMVKEIENNGGFSNIDLMDESYAILYKDGTIDIIDEEYDGHKVKRQNIVSIVYTNASTSIVYGPFEINEYGIVTVSDKIIIDNTNLVEIDHYIQ